MLPNSHEKTMTVSDECGNAVERIDKSADRDNKKHHKTKNKKNVKIAASATIMKGRINNKAVAQREGGRIKTRLHSVANKK